LDFSSRARERRRYIDTIKMNHTLEPVNCKIKTCGQWRRCSQVGLQSRLYGKDRAEIFFLFDSPGPQEVEEGLPLMGRSGSIFRDAILRPFTQGTPGYSYCLSYLVRSILEEEGKKFGKKEYEACWHNLMSDLGHHRPRLIVGFGAAVYSFLSSKAINRRELDLQIDGNPVMTNLRQHLFKLRLLDDYEPELLIAYSPGFVISNPTATRFLEEDTKRIIAASKGKYHPTDPATKESLVKIERIEVLRTVDEIINFLDNLAEGRLLQEEAAVAFDTETLNLNRKFNNGFLTWQFSFKKGEAVVLPIEHPDCPIFENPEAKIRLVEVAQRLFNNPTSKSRIRCFVAHNAKFDLGVLYGQLGIIQREEGSPYFWCTQNAMHWLDENRKSLARFMEAGDKPYSLKTLGKEFFNFRYRAEHLELRAEGSLSDLTLDDLAEYGGSDTILTLALYEHQQKLAAEQPKNALPKLIDFQRYYYSKTNRSLSLMECNGLYVSAKHIGFLQGADSPIWNRLNELRHNLLQNSPEVLDFRKKYNSRLSAKTNVNYDDLWGDDSGAPADLIEFDHKKKTHRDSFYLDFLKLEPLEFSQKTKEPSFDSSFLDHYSKAENYKQAPGVRPYLDYYNTPTEDPKTGELVFPANPIQLISELQKLDKLASGYLVSMQKLLDDKAGDCRDSRVRASFHPTGTDTGRLSSSSPNFQNLPAGRSKAAKEIKNMFQAEPPSKRWPNGTCLIQVDYAAAEVFWAVNFSEEPELVSFLNKCAEDIGRACSNDDSLSDEEFDKIILSTDFHKRTASLMFEISPDKVSKQMRQESKAITFGLLYGKTTQGLATDNGWTVEEAEAKMRKFFSAFPKLERWLKEQIETARRYGYVETLMGRRRRLSHFYATKQPKHAGEADRKAMNSPIQGQSSDAGVIGLNNFVDYVLEHGLERRWLIQNVVHDSILFQVPMEDIAKVLPVIKRCLTVGMREYIEHYWNIKIPVTLRCDFEIGLRYGDLHGWDQRQKTLGPLLVKIADDAKKLWGIEDKSAESMVTLKKPSTALDFVTWQGDLP